MEDIDVKRIKCVTFVHDRRIGSTPWRHGSQACREPSCRKLVIAALEGLSSNGSRDCASGSTNTLPPSETLAISHVNKWWITYWGNCQLYLSFLLWSWEESPPDTWLASEVLNHVNRFSCRINTFNTEGKFAQSHCCQEHIKMMPPWALSTCIVAVTRGLDP